MRFVVLMVNAFGHWGLWRFDDVDGSSTWTVLTSGDSAAVRKGLGNTNRLLVVTIGRLYLYYINGQLVGSYDDTRSLTTTTGQVGIFVNNAVAQGRFTDFALYTVPSPPNPLTLR